MKLKAKFVLGLAILITIPFSTTVMADDCFDTVITGDGNIYYIDPYHKDRVFEEKDTLLQLYGNKIECTGNKKTYSVNEYYNQLYNNQNKNIGRLNKRLGFRDVLIDLSTLIISCVAMRRIFVKAGKPGYHSLIPIYNFYELSDIAGLSKVFRKVALCFVFGILMLFYIPMFGLLLISILGIYGIVINFYIARNFGWSTIASILYVIFNPIAMLILAFSSDKYYYTKEKEKIKEMSSKIKEENNFKDTFKAENGLVPSVEQEPTTAEIELKMPNVDYGEEFNSKNSIAQKD